MRPAGDSVAGAGYTGPGFHYLGNVAKDTAPAGAFSVDWNVKDTWDILGNGAGAPTDIHLRLTMLTGTNDMVLADGIPPQNKPGNPKSLRYLIAHRTGTNLQSNFTSVLEPYQGDRLIRSVTQAGVKANGTPVTGDMDVKAVKVELVNGRTDYIVSALNPDVRYTIDDKLEFQGFFGIYSEQDGHEVYKYLNDGSFIGPIGTASADTSVQARVTGTIQDFTRELSTSNSLLATLQLGGVKPEQLIGRTLYAQNDGKRNAAYKIAGITSAGGNTYSLDIGDTTLIRSYVDANDFSKGFVYDVASGAAFIIPLSEESAPPVTTATVSGTLVNGWYTSDAVVTLQASDRSSEDPSIGYSLDGGATWSNYTGPLTISDSGVHQLLYRAVNTRGQQEAPRTLK
ncbi:hypothetical protein N6H14_14950 [Paenibacillus sp. CC-CFT747]|nr:hypothetical protein N6H14_14950 [Paenibacillus sp. CC-CFT747]